MLFSGIVDGEKKCSCGMKRKKSNSLPDDIVTLPTPSLTDLKANKKAQLVATEGGPENEAEMKAILGRATWTMLHTMAARYPDTPSEARKKRTAEFLKALGQLYPCVQCGKHMRTMMANYPPTLDTQQGFSRWMCTIHNFANKGLGKPQFPCENVDELYDCGCGLEDEDPEIETLLANPL